MHGNRFRDTEGRWMSRCNPYHDGTHLGGTIPEGDCPKCHKHYRGHPALSREDNKTKICPECGQREALEAFQGYLKIKHEKDETR